MNAYVPSIVGVHLVFGLRYADARGELRKVVTSNGLREAGASKEVDEVVMTSNVSAGTVRGLHYQCDPHQQAKTLWVNHGSLFDVLVDLRTGSSTFGRWTSFILSASDDYALHVPQGVAHGYQTLDDDTSVTYLIRGRHVPEHARTLAWDDAELAIAWPRPVSVISPSDRSGQPWPPPS